MSENTAKNRMEWSMAKGDLCREVLALGFPREFGDLLARELGSPRAIGRMAAYLRRAKPRSVEMIVDEMLAISAEARTWRERKESREAQAGYTAYLFERRTREEELEREERKGHETEKLPDRR